MRTTLSLDEDVFLAVKERARSGEAHCRGGAVGSRPSSAHGTTSRVQPSHADAFFGFDPLPHRGDAVSNALIDRLQEEDDPA